MANYVKDLKLFTDIVLKNYPENMRPTCIDFDVQVEHLREIEYQVAQEIQDPKAIRYNDPIAYPRMTHGHLEVRIFGMKFRFFPIQPKPEYAPSRRPFYDDKF